MKKIINFIMIVGTLGLLMPACTLDKFPTDAIPPETGLQTFADAESFRNGLYILLRGRYYGTSLTTYELMSDLFNAGSDFGNRGGLTHRLGSDFTADAIWANAFSAIAQINNFLEHIHNVNVGYDTVQRNAINDFIAEAHYMRAFLYMQMATGYMYPISDANRNTPHLGLPLLTLFRVSYQPSRATIQQTFEFILADIEEAEKISVVGAQRSQRITRDAVHALKARVLFMMRDNDGAAHYANLLINSGRYPLVRELVPFRDMWHRDGSTPEGRTEDIFVFNATSSAFGPTMGIYIGFTAATGKFSPDFIPTEWVVNLYEAGDLRRNVFLSNPATQVVANGSPIEDRPNVRFLNKFPGNPDLRPGGATANTNYAHFAKVHRIAEMYLIAAEAGQNLVRLNQLRMARGASFVPTWSDQEMRNEWVREMIGEGRRIESLRRWGPEYTNTRFTGRPPQSPEAVAFNGDQWFTNRHVTPDQFYRFTLPIPAHDVRTNPNMRQTPSWQ
jgi:hypothetical protein